MLKSWKEKCAVFGIWNDPDAGHMSYLGLYAQQHRGQEAAGIVSLEKNGTHRIRKGIGLVDEVFNLENLSHLKGKAAIGHLRYSTSGEKNLLTNAQPLTAQLKTGPIAIAHNGQFTNAETLFNQLKKKGFFFQGTNDTECLIPLLSQYLKEKNFISSLKRTLKHIKGAYSLTLLTKESLIAIRDPYGFRPLVLGERNIKKREKNKEQKKGGEIEESKSYVLASETCAFDLIEARYLREIEPGEILVLNAKGISSYFFSETHKRKKSVSRKKQKSQPLYQCIFEHVYFSRPDSLVFGKNVYESRKKMGAILAKEASIEADIVVPVPDSGVASALGFSKESQIPFELGIIRNHYIGRTFIQTHQSIRNFNVKVKLNPHSILKNKRVIIVDDSLVRGTTAKKIIQLVRKAGAKEIHFRVASPPIISPCYYGIDTPKKSELMAANKTQRKIKEFLNVDSLKYLSKEGLLKAVEKDKNSPHLKTKSLKSLNFNQKFCTSCFTGQYPFFN